MTTGGERSAYSRARYCNAFQVLVPFVNVGATLSAEAGDLHIIVLVGRMDLLFDFHSVTETRYVRRLNSHGQTVRLSGLDWFSPKKWYESSLTSCHLSATERNASSMHVHIQLDFRPRSYDYQGISILTLTLLVNV